MKINWKVRFQNKVWLMSFISLIVGFIYNILRAFDVIPTISQQMVMDIVGQVLTFLGMLGVIVDPTTEGLNDSKRAMSYEKPWVDEDENEEENDSNAEAE